MRRKMFLKITALFLSPVTLTSSTIDFAYILRHTISESKLAKNLSPVLNKFSFDNKGFFLCHAHKFLGFGLGHQDGRFTFCIKPFYQQKRCFSGFGSFLKKAILGANTFKQWRSSRQEEKKKIAEQEKRMLDEMKRAAKIPVPSLEEFENDFIMKETKFYIDEEKIYACSALKQLIQELKSIQSSYSFHISCEGQSMDFSKKLHYKIEKVIGEVNYYYEKMSSNDNYRLKLIKSCNVFSKETQSWTVFYCEEYKMNHSFFESPNGFARKIFDSLINQLKKSHKKMLDGISKKKDVLFDEVNSIKTAKERLVGFIRGTCALIDYLNQKIAYLNAKERYRWHASCAVSCKAEAAYSALGNKAKKSAIAKHYKVSPRDQYLQVVNIDKSYYMNALEPCEKLFAYYESFYIFAKI